MTLAEPSRFRSRVEHKYSLKRTISRRPSRSWPARPARPRRRVSYPERPHPKPPPRYEPNRKHLPAPKQEPAAHGGRVLHVANCATLRKCRPRGRAAGIATIPIVGRGAGRTRPTRSLCRLCDSAALASDRRKAIVAVGDVARLRIRVVRRHEVVPPPSERRGPLAVARRAAVSSPARVCRVRLYEPHKPGDRPVAADVTAEYDFRVRTEEKRAVALAAVALLVRSPNQWIGEC
jgi:hypothetical protein